ncbi:MAG: hypothetical protein ACK4M3_03495 [Pyrobaculum sp.]
MDFAKKLKLRLSDVIKLERPDNLSSKYGKAFEKAVLVLIKARDAAMAFRTFIENYGEPHTGAFSKLLKLLPWAKKVVEIEPAPPVWLQVDGVTISAQADFIVKYSDGRKELVELKSHILKNGEWKTKVEWSLATKIMRMVYRKSGYDYPLRLIYFTEKSGNVAPEEEVFIYPKDDKDDETVLKVLRERVKKSVNR